MSANQIHVLGGYRREEAAVKSGSSFLPGHLLKVQSDGTVDKHNVAGDWAERIVAEIDPLQGGVNNGTEAGTGYTGTLYTSGSLAQYNVEDPGAESLVFLKSGQTAVIGSKLVSNGDGTLKVEAGAPSFGSTKSILAVAMDALDLSDGGSVDTLLRIRWL